MKPLKPRLAAVLLTVPLLAGAMLLGPLTGAASAHERRTVGTLQLVVGWGSEPTYTGYLNGVQITIRDVSGPEPVPVTDAADSLTVEVTFGDQKVGPLELESVFGSPGEYQAAMVPTRTGVYTFRFVGTVKGQSIDEKFTSSDTTFESPGESSEIEFPVKDPSSAELASRVERLDPRIAVASKAADDAKSKGGTATVLAVVGLLVGLAGVGLAVTARRGAKA
jgi:hypothetical protein